MWVVITLIFTLGEQQQVWPSIPDVSVFPDRPSCERSLLDEYKRATVLNTYEDLEFITNRLEERFLAIGSLNLEKHCVEIGRL